MIRYMYAGNLQLLNNAIIKTKQNKASFPSGTLVYETIVDFGFYA